MYRTGGSTPDPYVPERNYARSVYANFYKVLYHVYQVYQVYRVYYKHRQGCAFFLKKKSRSPTYPFRDHTRTDELINIHAIYIDFKFWRQIGY